MSEEDFTANTPDGSLKAIWKPESKSIDLLDGSSDEWKLVFSVTDIALPADKAVTSIEFDPKRYV